MSSAFGKDDPKSKNWRRAFIRFMQRELDPVPHERIETVKDLHHKGWRLGVLGVKDGKGPAHGAEAGVLLGSGPERRALDHGRVAGRKETLAWLEETGRPRHHVK